MLIDTLQVSSMPRKDLEAIAIYAAQVIQALHGDGDPKSDNSETLAHFLRAMGVLS